jgi:hypothetical protein
MKRLQPRQNLPHVQSRGEWLTGYWTGLAVGLVIGLGAAVAILKGVR